MSLARLALSVSVITLHCAFSSRALLLVAREPEEVKCRSVYSGRRRLSRCTIRTISVSSLTVSLLIPISLLSFFFSFEIVESHYK
ncbi:hypothetical protein CC79DRAFT_1132678 [Sarocladium strictum]